MKGWNLQEGDLKDNSKENLFSYLSNSLFEGKHTTTYKYCLLKSILDNIYNFDSSFQLSFNLISDTVASIYWNMINVYKMPQRPDYINGSRSAIEKIVEDFCHNNPYTMNVNYYSLNDNDREIVKKKIKEKFSQNVYGAFYEDTKGNIFGFSKKTKLIWCNDYSLSFFKKNKRIIEQVNYYLWLKKIESILKANDKKIDNLSTIIEDITKRINLSGFKDELIRLGEVKKCFYCDKEINRSSHLDHVIPWDYLKSDNLWNFVFSCPTCNKRKNDKIPTQSFLDKLQERNRQLNISSPDINELVANASINGVKINWQP